MSIKQNFAQTNPEVGEIRICSGNCFVRVGRVAPHKICWKGGGTHIQVPSRLSLPADAAIGGG